MVNKVLKGPLSDKWDSIAGAKIREETQDSSRARTKLRHNWAEIITV